MSQDADFSVCVSGTIVDPGCRVSDLRNLRKGQRSVVQAISQDADFSVCVSGTIAYPGCRVSDLRNLRKGQRSVVRELKMIEGAHFQTRATVGNVKDILIFPRRSTRLGTPNDIWKIHTPATCSRNSSKTSTLAKVSVTV
ncbi:hypothetical protein JOB18_013911 [Solea senegalensis]|uniref:Uncharacterized protein n=1 Tax=Solea senegalensis TaxID=28829 RepID=A0AAV6PCV9_SOLSE|nr:hypothetical protein JOB18_013911 [Solea senegalensis]